jgi:hypothetical protein
VEALAHWNVSVESHHVTRHGPPIKADQEYNRLGFPPASATLGASGGHTRRGCDDGYAWHVMLRQWPRKARPSPVAVAM